MKNQYKQITFCESWKEGSKTFEQFKAEFEEVWVFAILEPKERLVKLKEAFKVATSGVLDIKVKDAKIVTKAKQNSNLIVKEVTISNGLTSFFITNHGKLPATNRKSKTIEARKDFKGTVQIHSKY